ncbi:MAG: selenium cofactor biosynthesis protein YqeC [Thermodesulfobacteriota bacterium]
MTPNRAVLLEALGIDRSAGGVVALVGGGGKTSLMWALAGELRARSLTVVTTTTTKIFPPQPGESPCLLIVSRDSELNELPHLLAFHGHVTVTGPALSAGKLGGITNETVELCATLAQWVIVEADGAAGKPIKAPEDWEPVIPRSARLVVPVVGLDCLGMPVSEVTVFRVERFLEVTGSRRGDPITPRVVAGLLHSAAGALKGIPRASTVVPFLNKFDLLPDTAPVREIARNLSALGTARIGRIVAGTLKPDVCAIVFPVAH